MQNHNCKHNFINNQCKKCSIFNYPSSAFKSSTYSHPSHTPPKIYLRNLRKHKTKIIAKQSIPSQVVEFAQNICRKFNFKNETLALAFYYYQLMRHMSKGCEQFWMACCLIVSGKAIELDKYVPYLDRFQRYADQSFDQQQYQRAELKICQMMDFKLQHTTLLTFLNFYLTCGVVFKQDSNSHLLFDQIEKEAMESAISTILDGTFVASDPELLALNIIGTARKNHGLERWNQCLTMVSGKKQYELRLETNLHESNQLNSDRYRHCSLKQQLDCLFDAENTPILQSLSLNEQNLEKTIKKPATVNSSGKQSSKENNIPIRNGFSNPKITLRTNTYIKLDNFNLIQRRQ